MDRKAQKVIMFGLNYGMSGKSQFMQTYIEELARMSSAAAIARNTGIGWFTFDEADYTGLELRCMQYHDETQVEVITHDRVHQMGKINKAPHLKSIACKVVESGGKLQLTKFTWYNWFN